MNSDGALPDCIPFYGHGYTDSDPGWGFAAWSITDWFSDYCEKGAAVHRNNRNPYNSKNRDPQEPLNDRDRVPLHRR
jgi:hypothetical protein